MQQVNDWLLPLEADRQDGDISLQHASLTVLLLYLGDHGRPVVLRAVDPSVFTALLLQAVGFQHRQVPEGGLEAGHGQVLHETQLITAAAAPLWLPVVLRRDVVIMSNYFLEAEHPSTGPAPAPSKPVLKLETGSSQSDHHLYLIQWREVNLNQ